MANNATTVWRWKGTVSTAWDAANWLNAAGVQVDDWPTGSKPTHTVKFLGADKTTLCETGPAATTTLKDIQVDADYGEVADYDALTPVVFSDMLVGTLTVAETGDDHYGVRVAGGTITTMAATGYVYVTAGLIVGGTMWKGTVAGGTVTNLTLRGTALFDGAALTGTLKMYESSGLDSGSIGTALEIRSGDVLLMQQAGKTLTLNTNALIKVYVPSVAFGGTSQAFNLACATTPATTIQMLRREATVSLGKATISTGTLKIDTSRAYGFGGNQIV
jgi:hypothetical protein